MVEVPLSTCILVYILCSWISIIHAAKCLDVEEHNQCHQFDDFCYKERQDVLDCRDDKEYHCGRDAITKKFKEACASPKECGIGKEPWIFTGPDGASVKCHFCYDSHYYNPYPRTMSTQYSHCEEEKDDCSPNFNMFKCDLREDEDLYTKNVRCRCDVRGGYRIDRSYMETEPACSYERGLSCVPAQCPFPDMDVRIIGYKCVPKCPTGYSRSSQYSDECIQEITPAPPITPKPESTLSPPVHVLPNVSAPIIKTHQTTTLAPNTYTIFKSTTIKTADIAGSPPSDNSDTLIKVTIAAVCAPLGLLILLLIVWGCIRRRQINQGRRRYNPVDIIVDGDDTRRNPDDLRSDHTAQLVRYNSTGSVVFTAPYSDTAGQNGGNEKRTTNGTPVPNVTNITTIYRGPVTYVKGKSSATVVHTKADNHAIDSSSEDESSKMIRPECSPPQSQHASRHSLHSLKPHDSRKQPNNMEEGNYSKTDNMSDDEAANVTDGKASNQTKTRKHLATSQPSSTDSLKHQSLREMHLSKNEIDGAYAQDANYEGQKSSEKEQDRSQSVTLSEKSGSEVRQKLKRRTSKSMSDLPFQVVILHPRNVQKDIKAELPGNALDGCYTALVRDLDPQLLFDRFIEKKLFKGTVIRDMKQEPNDSERNRSIIKNISRSGWKKYVKFKECLNESDQGNIVKLLQKKEKLYLQEIAKSVLRDTDIKDLTELLKCFDKSVLPKEQQELMSKDLQDKKNLDALARHKDAMVEKCEWGVYARYKDYLRETKQQTTVEEMESLELKHKDINLSETIGDGDTRNDDTVGVFSLDGIAAQGSDASEINRSTGGSPLGDIDHDPNDDTKPKELLQHISVDEQEKVAQQLLNKLASCRSFEDFVELSDTMKVPNLTYPDHVDLDKLRKKKYIGCPEGFQAYHTSGAHNCCLYQSFSCLLFGDESQYKTLRLIAALHAGRRWEKIIQEYQTTLKDSPKDEVLSYLLSMASNPSSQLENAEVSNEELIDQFMKKLIRETAVLGTDSCQIHVYFLSRALGRSVISHSHRPEDRLADQIVSGDDNPLHIMWVNFNNNPNGAPNHVVPLIRTTDEMMTSV